MKEFIQSGPSLLNQYDHDVVLKTYLAEKLPSGFMSSLGPSFSGLGERVVSDILNLARQAERNPPKLIQFDPWGKRIDEVVVDSSWQELHRVSAEEEIVSVGYSREYKEYSRIVQFARLYLFHPSSAFYSCPLAMTDGAAKLLELYGGKDLKKSFVHLTSKNPDYFWTSGQWMTERSGGSDVSHSETIAKFENGEWRLYGTKWFTSAITSEMAMALARVVDDNGNRVEGSRGLSLFYVEIKNQNDELNNIEVLRLKDKLGTRALPTAELKLKGTSATLVGNVGEGVKQISSMFNVTRLYNSVTSVAALRRILALAEDYASKRKAFSKVIAEHTLTAQVLAEAQLWHKGCFYFTFLVAEFFGNEEVYKTSNTLGLEREELNKILRLLTPVVKLYTAKKTVQWTSELLEVFGGVGYIEDSEIPTLYRDSQVFSIWEGTTNVLSLDLLRALKKDQSWPVLFSYLTKELNEVRHQELLIEARNKLKSKLEACNELIMGHAESAENELEFQARKLAFRLGDLVSAIAWYRYLNNKKTLNENEAFSLEAFLKLI